MAEKYANMPENLPLEVELDLLVDEELPEDRRRELLRSLDKAPARWRELSIRFLERQVERKSARQVITAGSLKSGGETATEAAAALVYKFPALQWLTPMRFAGIAAGLLIAVSSALLTSYVLRQAGTPAPDHRSIVTREAMDTIDTKLPGSVVGMDKAEIPVQVSVLPVRNDSANLAFFPRTSGEEPGSRRSVVIKPDGIDNALVIPVKGLQFQ